MSRLDELLDPLVEAVLSGWRGPDQLRARLAEGLRASVKDQGGNVIDGVRLDKVRVAQDAAEMVAARSNATEVVALVADLLLGVREADQRERWIQDGYSFDARMAWDRAAAAEREAADLRHALRVVKRATRGVKVGRE